MGNRRKKQTGPRVDAIRGISFSISRGELVLIVGPSGSGKSTLLQILGGLDHCSQGKIWMEEAEITHASTQELSRIRNARIGFVFQRFNLLPGISALDNVALPMLYAGKNRTERRKRATELLDMVGLSDRTHHRPNQLSGGQQQRVAIARALANDPLFLLADEPTGNLDTKSGEEILALFSKLNEMGKTVIMVTHDLELLPLAHRVLYMRDGVIEAQEGTSDGNPS
ncbi:MAG TPA: ABC transporter ATP-binding protein [Thermotogota bacterium]|nr:ABC transporter ATP-binding protein [Thermotogota bacterium]HRW92774.1 ABC transporter ATP-binding protein [Thermotogota bacterium]